MNKQTTPVNTPIFNISNPATRQFLEVMKAVKENPMKISDFLDDRIPAMREQNVDPTLIQEKPKGIKSDKDMYAAWNFLQMMLKRDEFQAMTPLEVVELYKVMNENGLAYQEYCRLSKTIKEKEKEASLLAGEAADSVKEELNALYMQKTHAEDIYKRAYFTRRQRICLTQAVLVIGFIKEYVSLRAVRIENAEESPVFIPINAGDGVAMQGIYVDDTNEVKSIHVAPGDYLFYANTSDSLTQYPKTTKFIPVIKKTILPEYRYGDDMLDYVSVQVKMGEDLVITYTSDPVTVDQIKEAQKSLIPSPLLTANDIAKTEATENPV